MKCSFYSILEKSMALIAKFFLVSLVTPFTGKLQQLNLKSSKKHFFDGWKRSLITFLNWLCQGLITLAYPRMGYNPVEARRERHKSQWAAELLGMEPSQLVEDARETIAQIQHVPPSASSSQKIPTFTVLICFHHHLSYFKSSLASLQEACVHSPATQVEILIINDDPSISSEELLAQASASLQEKMTLYSHKKNLGICNSANEAVALAQGEWILHLDCDDRLSPHVFSTLTKTISEYPGVRYISSRAIDIDQNGKILSWRLRAENPCDLVHDNVASHLKVIRKDLHDDIGLFNPIFEGCQDYEFALRTAINEPLCFIADYLYEYRWHDHSQTVSNNKKQNLTANRIRQIYLLVASWIHHGIKDVHWEITGIHASSWSKHLYCSRDASLANPLYSVILETTSPYAPCREKQLLIEVATIIIDRYRTHELDTRISVMI